MVILGNNLQKKKILMDLEGNVYDSLDKFKKHEPKSNGQEYISVVKEKEPPTKKASEVQLEGMVGRTDDNKVGTGGDVKKTDNEQIRIVILDSDLSNRDKVFMTMLLKDKTKEDAIGLILTAPLKDTQKVNLMKSLK